MNTRLCGALCAGMISLGVAAHSHAVPVTAVFDSTIDLSGLGGAANAPFKIEYTYDNATPDLNGSNLMGEYSVLSGTAQIGNDNLTFGSGVIAVINDFFPNDSYYFTANDITGTVLGTSLVNLGFDLNDNDGTMFPDTNLPADFSFASGVDTGRRFVSPSLFFRIDTTSSTSNGQFFALDFAGNTTTPLSEPSVILLMGLGLTGLIGFMRRRNSHV